MNLPPPITVVMNEQGQIGMSVRPQTAIDRAILSGILFQASQIMSQCELDPKPGIVVASGAIPPGLNGRNGK